jgi:C-terminal processing protease CtpA/Prc
LIMNKQNQILLSILVLGFLVGVITLTACKVLPTAAPTVVPTLTPTPTRTPIPTRTPHPAAMIEDRLTPAERLAIFNAVWQTINDEYYDPTFGGKDWQAIGDEYRQRLENIDGDTAFWLGLLNPMLFELGVSHLVALPPGMANELDRMTFATGSLGLDVRLLDGLAVVTQVVEDSPADQAGLHPGYVITSLDGWTLEVLTAESLQTPPYNERHQQGIAIQGMRGMLYGETGKDVVVEYLDEKDRPQSATL